MKAREVFKRLSSVIRIEDSFRNEPYGAYNFKNEDWEKDVKRILFCVTATSEVVDHFIKEKYDLLIQHHPFVLPHLPHFIFHTALDCCEGGHNDMWRDALGVKNAKHFDKNMGWYGEISPISFAALQAKCEAFIDGKKTLGYTYTNGQPVQSVVICSGLGGIDWEMAEACGGDCYVTGQLIFPRHGKFKHIIELGHTQTEYIGVNLIRKLLPELQVDSCSLDIDVYGEEVSYEDSFQDLRRFAVLSPVVKKGRGKKRVFGIKIVEADAEGNAYFEGVIDTVFAETEALAVSNARERAEDLGYDLIESLVV